MYIAIRVKYLYSCPILMKREFYQQIFEKSTNIEFREYLISGSRVVPCGRTDMTKLIVAVRNFANVPTNAPLTELQLSNSPSKIDSLKFWLSNMPVSHKWGEMFSSEVLQYYYAIQNQLVNQTTSFCNHLCKRHSHSTPFLL